jgi:hypothetical protein
MRDGATAAFANCGHFTLIAAPPDYASLSDVATIHQIDAKVESRRDVVAAGDGE